MALPRPSSSRALPGRLQRALFSSSRSASDGQQLPSGVPPLRILHRSPGLVVVHKPVGLVAQGGVDHARLKRGEATLEQHFSELSRRLGLTPSSSSPGNGAPADDHGPHGIRPLHRLDKDVEGPLVLALTQARAKEVARQFQRHEVVKTYYALISRYIPASERPPLLPATEAILNPTTHFTVVSPTGLVSADPGPATSSLPPSPTPSFGLGPTPMHAPRQVHANLTAWAFLGGSPNLNLSLVRLHPVTGRKHQLRVFCADSLGAPIVGDTTYGFVSPPPSPPSPAAAGAKGRKGTPPGPTDETPLFLRCTALGLTVRSPGGRAKPIVVRGPGDHEGGWEGVREWMDEWVGEPLAEQAATAAAGAGAGGDEGGEVDGEAREARERARVLERRAGRQAAKNAASARGKEERIRAKAAADDDDAVAGGAAGG